MCTSVQCHTDPHLITGERLTKVGRSFGLNEPRGKFREKRKPWQADITQGTVTATYEENTGHGLKPWGVNVVYAKDG